MRALDLEAIQARLEAGTADYGTLEGVALSLLGEIRRMRSFIDALALHATTTWPDSGCGSGRPAGQVLTTTAHVGAIQTLIFGCQRGWTITETADAYEAEWPGATRLDGPAAKPSRAGPDGRPATRMV